MDIALDHRGVDTHLTPLHHLLRQRDLHDPVMDLLDDAWSERDAPAPHGLGIGHLAGADAGEVAIHQIGPDFPFQDRIAPIANVLQDQQAQHDFGWVAQTATPAAVGIAVRQRLVDC